MKKNKFLQIGLIILAAICACLCFWVAPMGQSVTQAASKSAVQNVYIGDTFEAKDYKMLSVDGDVTAEGMRIVYPSGGIYGSDKFVVELTGKYEITYYATVDGFRVEETKNYLAIRRPQDMIITNSTMKVEYGKYFVNESPYALTKDTYGVKVYFKAGQACFIPFKIMPQTNRLRRPLPSIAASQLLARKSRLFIFLSLFVFKYVSESL